jgi:hypothetical protein
LDEGRKRLVGYSILAARKLVQFKGRKRVPVTPFAIADAERWVEEIVKVIDETSARCPIKEKALVKNALSKLREPAV